MTKLICLLAVFLGFTCQAQNNFAKSSVNWLKSTLPESTELKFNKSRIKFNGCKYREFELLLNQPLTENISIEGGLSYAKGRIDLGVSRQKISVKRYSLMPRYHLNHTASFSAGVILQSAPEFKTSQGFEIDLPQSRIYMVSSRLQGLRNDHQVDIELSSQQWDATGEFGSLFDKGLVDNKINVSYSAFF